MSPFPKHGPCMHVSLETSGGGLSSRERSCLPGVWCGRGVRDSPAQLWASLPHYAIVLNNLPRSHHGAMEVARALLGRHAHTRVIQEGARRTGAAIHRHEGDATGDISLTQGTARGLAGIHHIGVALGLGATVHVLRCRRQRWGTERSVASRLAQLLLCSIPDSVSPSVT